MTDSVRIFVGTDPGAKGACGVIACVHSPLDDSRHGAVVGHAVFDLPTCERTGLDGGGEDLDVEAFRSRLSSAINEARGQGNVVRQEAVVEYPDVGGRMKGGRRQTLVQGLNAGMAFAAVRSLGIDASWASSRSWRAELALDTLDLQAARVALGMPPHAESPVLCHEHGKGVNRVLVASPDRCVAVLLAEVQRRRWLGIAAVPAKKGVAKVAKARKSAERKAALARAVAPLAVAKARERVIMEHWCEFHKRVKRPCAPHNRCCEARLLEWAWRQRPEPSETSLALGAAAVELLPRIVAIYRRAVTSARWTVAWHDSEETGTMEDAAFDALEAHGLIQLVPGLKAVRYAPTERGLEWAERLRRVAVSSSFAVRVLAPAVVPR